MKKTAITAALWLGMLGIALAAIPTSITYQGTLKEKGLPATGTKSVLFRITSQDGTQVYWSSPQTTVSVVNGLFSAQISPTGVDWQNVTPYLEVSVEGQLLLPREPVNATVYAVISSSVADNAIKPSNIVPGFGLVPSGMIAMFATSCPPGWNEYSSLQGKFPVGADGVNFIAGSSGGNMTHSHSVILAPHTHSITDQTLRVAIGIRNINYDNYLAMQVGSGVGAFSQSTANQWFGYGSGMASPAPIGTNSGNVSVNGPRISGGTDVATFSGPNTTDAQSTLPPYLGLIFCQKL